MGNSLGGQGPSVPPWRLACAKEICYKGAIFCNQIILLTDYHEPNVHEWVQLAGRNGEHTWTISATSPADRSTYLPPPTASGVSPKYGPPSGGTCSRRWRQW